MTGPDLVALSDERDLSLLLRLTAWQEGHAAGAAGAWSAGYAHAIAQVKAAQHGIVHLAHGLAETETARWTLRGERRTRGTFALPHPADYPGRDGAT